MKLEIPLDASREKRRQEPQHHPQVPSHFSNTSLSVQRPPSPSMTNTSGALNDPPNRSPSLMNSVWPPNTPNPQPSSPPPQHSLNQHLVPFRVPSGRSHRPPQHRPSPYRPPPHPQHARNTPRTNANAQSHLPTQKPNRNHTPRRHLSETSSQPPDSLSNVPERLTDLDSFEIFPRSLNHRLSSPNYHRIPTRSRQPEIPESTRHEQSIEQSTDDQSTLTTATIKKEASQERKPPDDWKHKPSSETPMDRRRTFAIALLVAILVAPIALVVIFDVNDKDQSADLQPLDPTVLATSIHSHIPSKHLQGQALWANHVVKGNERLLIAETFESRLNAEVAPVLERHIDKIWDRKLDPPLRCHNGEKQIIAFSMAKSGSLPASISVLRRCPNSLRARVCPHKRYILDVRDLVVALPPHSSRFTYSVQIVEERGAPLSADELGVPRRVKPFGTISGPFRIELSDVSRLALQRYCGTNRRNFASALLAESITARNTRLLPVYELKRLFGLLTGHPSSPGTTRRTWDSLQLSKATINPIDHSPHSLPLSHLQTLITRIRGNVGDFGSEELNRHFNASERPDEKQHEPVSAADSRIPVNSVEHGDETMPNDKHGDFESVLTETQHDSSGLKDDSFESEAREWDRRMMRLQSTTGGKKEVAHRADLGNLNSEHDNKKGKTSKSKEGETQKAGHQSDETNDVINEESDTDSSSSRRRKRDRESTKDDEVSPRKRRDDHREPTDDEHTVEDDGDKIPSRLNEEPKRSKSFSGEEPTARRTSTEDGKPIANSFTEDKFNLEKKPDETLPDFTMSEKQDKGSVTTRSSGDADSTEWDSLKTSEGPGSEATANSLRNPPEENFDDDNLGNPSSYGSQQKPATYSREEASSKPVRSIEESHNTNVGFAPSQIKPGWLPKTGNTSPFDQQVQGAKVPPTQMFINGYGDSTKGYNTPKEFYRNSPRGAKPSPQRSNPALIINNQENRITNSRNVANTAPQRSARSFATNVNAKVTGSQRNHPGSHIRPRSMPPNAESFVPPPAYNNAQSKPSVQEFDNMRDEAQASHSTAVFGSTYVAPGMRAERQGGFAQRRSGGEAAPVPLTRTPSDSRMPNNMGGAGLYRQFHPVGAQVQLRPPA